MLSYGCHCIMCMVLSPVLAVYRFLARPTMKKSENIRKAIHISAMHAAVNNFLQNNSC